MNRLTPILFSILYLVAMVRPVAPVFEYILNRDYIANALCENNDKPELNCQGKCYLMQKIAEQKPAQNQSLPVIDLSEYPIGFVDILALPVKNAYNILSYLDFEKSDHYTYLFEYSDFHPPTNIF